MPLKPNKKPSKKKLLVKAKVNGKVKANPRVKKLSSTKYEITFPNQQVLYLLGTVHISPESVKLVEKTIRAKQPKKIFIELDEERKNNLVQKIQNIDIIKIIRAKKTIYFLSYLFLAIVQKKFAEKTGSPPGEEFKKAILLAKSTKAKEFLVDRNAKITINRIYRNLTWGEKIRLLFSLFSFSETSIPDKNSPAPEHNKKNFDYKEIIQQDVISKMIEEMGRKFANIKQVLIDERDIYMSKNILVNLQKERKSLRVVNHVAVVGAGHLAGMIGYFKNPSLVKDYSLEKLETVPPKSLLDKLVPFLIMGLILLVFGLGFFFSDNQDILTQSLGIWVLANGSFSALGSLLALANPITIIVAFLAAPITSLNPTIGAGMVTSLVQALLSPPRIRDFQEFSLKMTKVKYWWGNRLGKILLVFIFSSLGSGLGTLIAFPFILSLF